MKKLVIICLLLLVALLSACSTDKEPVSGESVNQKKEKEQEPKQDPQQDQEEETEKEDDPPVTAEITEPKFKINQKNWSVRPLNKSVNDKVALLTIDDAPDKYAVEMAKTLKELDAGAIFFVNGHFLETPEEKESLKKIHDLGFMIGNHSYSHRSLPDLSKEEQKKEIIRVNEMVEKIIGEKPSFFRAPFGQNTDYTKQVAKEEGMTLMNWTYGYDWNKEFMSKDAITDIMLHTNLLVDGANLLMHDREWTSEALNDIVVGLRDQGYEIVDPHLIKTN